jgi:hypothetical protein
MFPYVLRNTEMKDAGEFMSATPEWDAGDRFTGDGRRLRIVDMLETESDDLDAYGAGSSNRSKRDLRIARTELGAVLWLRRSPLLQRRTIVPHRALDQQMRLPVGPTTHIRVVHIE